MKHHPFQDDHFVAMVLVRVSDRTSDCTSVFGAIGIRPIPSLENS